MSAHVAAGLARLVRDRAGQVCEYCRLPQVSQEANFHVDHVVPRAAGGLTRPDNLALACVTCSLKKAARTHARDPASGLLVPLYHPRYDVWSDHFRYSSRWRLIGRTPTGRATLTALGMNRPALVAIRKVLVRLGQLTPTPYSE